MKILSIDTSSNICGVSILEDTNLICNLDTNTGRTHSENLMPLVKNALQEANTELKNIDLIVCDIGPGSFTGIRIGVATAKAFSDSLNIPCVGISSLEALAYNVLGSEYICSIIDCKNDNCYFALYEKKDDGLATLIEPQAESVPDTLAILDNYSHDTLNSVSITFVGDGAEIYKSDILQSFKNANFIHSDFNVLNSESLGVAGFLKYTSGEELQDFLPLYLKKPQAQRQLEEKENKS